MNSIFEELNENDVLKGLDVEREEWLDQLGLYNLHSGKVSFIDLNSTPTGALNDLLMQSLSYLEFINETLGRCDKRKRDSELDMEKELNRSISTSGLKLTESKALAKTSENYIKANKRYNSLSAYHDYLKRYMETIEKYHYSIKNRIQALQGIKEKYGNQS